MPTCVLVAALAALSQAQAPGSGSGAPQPKVQPAKVQPQTKIQVNFLNPCRPAASELDQMGRALAQVKERPRFSADFEVARGVTTLTEAEARVTGAPSDTGPSSWVRIRHEFPDKAPLSDAQYSLSFESGSASETLALHLRDTKEVLQIMISDSVTGSAAQAVQANTPPDRIRIERFGKSSVVLARCPGMDQSAYEPMFQTAGEILERYRAAMAIRTVVPAELAHLPGGRESKAAGANH